ncbi:MAG TPA: DUF3857 domain-containing protein [Puia sp.]|nr:DUF3857 domain-containing protein [Puia sp.]
MKIVTAPLSLVPAAWPMALLFFTVFFISGALLGQKPAVAGEPSWISRTATDYNSAKVPGDAEDGYSYLALERQVNVAAHTVYHKTVIKIITEAGIQNASEVSVSYDPSYQHMVFHNIQIIRDGVVINKLNPAKIKTIQQEKELDRSIYNGTVTAVLFLEDVRKGDRIEYAYSVLGFNPVFRDKYSAELQAQYGAPIGRLLYRIICPADRQLNIKNRLTDRQPEITQQGKDKVYQWEFKDVAALRAQDALPSWYDPYPSIQVSEYTSWNEVCKWDLPLFTDRAPISGHLKKKIEEIQSASGADDEKKILAALRFVQDEVRYMGIEMGVNSHKPNDPEKIFAQRFGDCKDKSFLLCTMLKAMGIEASPVFINTSDKQEIMRWLPTPLAFDHVTVRVRLKDKYYWFDPTISFQRGGIKDIAYPDYKCGLVLTDTTTGLTVIPLQDPGQVVAKENFTLKDTHGPASLEVVTRYTGSFADEIRNEINSNAKSDLQQTYLNFYNGFYEGAKVSDSLKIEEDEKDGAVTTYEYYTIYKMWEREKGMNKAAFDALLISSLVKKPKEHDRTMPIALTYPAHYVEQIQIRVPEDWHFEQAPSDLRSPGFIFHSSVDATDRTVNLRYEYRALKDHITADEASTYLSDYDKLKDDLGYELTEGSPVTSSSTSSSPAFGQNNALKALLCLALLAGITYMARRKR